MPLTRRSLFRGAFFACAFFAARRVLPEVEEEQTLTEAMFADAAVWYFDSLERQWREFYLDVSDRTLAIIQTTPSATHWLEGPDGQD